ncbi:MFS transporter [Mangrovihabitans endophyticus]|uniref:MFS transporter n=1 Tax=Mangrovihabitans endophyticus TaxID=1751298 RepID=A0A8J3BUF6_9ACTN|nr:MFS transporter [Mangrovihabitans endophyticus]GGK78949.1 MFS transporter [Mangrovihabitans endophyticus]
MTPLVTASGKLLPPAGPVRALTVATLASRFGRGLFYTIAPLYLTRVIGLSVGSVALGLTVASLAGLLAGIPTGYLADRLGPRRMRIVCRSIEGLLLCGYLVIRDFPTFLAVASLVTFFESAGQAAEGALIAGSVPADERVRARAYLRSVTNAAWAVGAAAAGAALLSDTRAAYLVIILIAAISYLVSAWATRGVPPVPPAPHVHKGPRLVALRDRPYLTLTLLNGVLGMNLGLFTVALPLYISQRTQAPVVLYSLISLVNTLAVTFLQVRASRGTGTVEGAATAQLRSGLLLFLCCAFFAVADGTPAGIAIAFLLLGACAHVAGELLQAAGSWGISFELAPDGMQGQYQGLYGMGRDLGQVLTPLVTVTLMIDFGWPGCLALGVLFLAAGLTVRFAARWASASAAARHETSKGVQSHPGRARP